jgi:hypothetical protein
MPNCISPSDGTSLKDLVPLITALIGFAGLILSVTIFKWNESWHNAEQVSRALFGLLLNYTRHGIANMAKITDEYENDTKRSHSCRIPAEEMLLRQKYEMVGLTDTTKERMQLLGPSIIYGFERLSLVIRNINIEIDATLRRLNQGKHLDYEARERDVESIFRRNLRIVVLADEIASQIGRLLAKNKTTSYIERFVYIFNNRGTIFNRFEHGTSEIQLVDAVDIKMINTENRPDIKSVIEWYIHSDDRAMDDQYKEYITRICSMVDRVNPILSKQQSSILGDGVANPSEWE